MQSRFLSRTTTSHHGELLANQQPTTINYSDDNTKSTCHVQFYTKWIIYNAIPARSVLWQARMKLVSWCFLSWMQMPLVCRQMSRWWCQNCSCTLQNKAYKWCKTYSSFFSWEGPVIHCQALSLTKSQNTELASRWQWHPGQAEIPNFLNYHINQNKRFLLR